MGGGGATQRTQTAFGARLRALREAAALSQEELAARANLTVHAVSALERGTRTRPYPNTVRALADALGVSEEERVDLVATIPRRRRASGDADTPGPHRSGRLPAATTRLLAREDDVAALAALLRHPDRRIVTLTGTGGVGKTRLSIAAADAVVADFPDGVVFVELAPLVDPGLVLPAVADALDLPASEGADARAVVVEGLRDRRLLLVLDNFEHLLSAAAEVAALVPACPGLTVLVSSRAPLRVRGETEYPVPPLALPDTAAPEAVAASPAGGLFLERARAARPDLELTAPDAAAVAEICNRLAGLPLALELVAAWTRMLSPVQLLGRLDQVVEADGARDLPARQRTLRAALDWSHGLLDESSRRLLALVSVFTGGFTLEAAETVVRESDWMPAGDVLPALSALVDHSLVLADPTAAGLRYRMLEPVAQYAADLLSGTGCSVQVSAAFVRCFRDLAERAAPEYQRSDQVVWLDRVDAEHANLTRAMAQALTIGAADDAGRIGWALWLYWWLRGHHLRGRILLEEVLDHDLSDEVRMLVENAAACMAFAHDDIDAARSWWQSTLESAHRLQAPVSMANATAGIGLAALASGDLDEAERWFRAALPLAHRAGPDGEWLSGLTQIWLGTVLLLGGDVDAASEHTEAGLASARARQDRLTIYVGLFNRSRIAAAGGDHVRARAHLVEGMHLSTETGDVANLAYFLEALAVLDALDGWFERVPVLLGAAHGLREPIGSSGYGYYQPDQELARRTETAARAHLGDDAYDDGLDRGRSLEPSEAVELAVSDARTR